MSRSETSLLASMNRVRAEHGLAPLSEDLQLDVTARAHTRWMLGAKTFAHGDFATRMARSHCRARTFGENLAWGVGSAASADAFVRAWLASPAHRRNLLRPGFRHVGLGRMTGSFYGYDNAAVVTADFSGR
jgi:uncharacterized protein YkwD